MRPSPSAVARHSPSASRRGFSCSWWTPPQASQTRCAWSRRPSGHRIPAVPDRVAEDLADILEGEDRALVPVAAAFTFAQAAGIQHHHRGKALAARLFQKLADIVDVAVDRRRRQPDRLALRGVKDLGQRLEPVLWRLAIGFGQLVQHVDEARQMFLPQLPDVRDAGRLDEQVAMQDLSPRMSGIPATVAAITSASSWVCPEGQAGS